MLAKKKPVIEKAILKFGKEFEFKRKKKNEFGEVVREIVIAYVRAFYYKGSNGLSIGLELQGEIKTNKSEKLMMSINREAAKLKAGDTFMLNGIKYELSDISNSFDLYYDITLKKVSESEHKN